MELDEDREPIPDAETMEFYRIGPPVPSILRKPGQPSKRRLEVSRRVSFSKEVSEGSTESLPHDLLCNGPPPGRTLRKKQAGVTPSPPHRNREYVKASPAEEVLRNLEESDYAVPNLVFLTERSRRRRVRTPVVVLRRHPSTESSSLAPRRTTGWNKYRFRRLSTGARLTTRRQRFKTTRRTAFQWRSKVLASPDSTTDAGEPPANAARTFSTVAPVQDNALFPATEVGFPAELSSNETLLAVGANGSLVTNSSETVMLENVTALVGLSTEKEPPLTSVSDDGDDSGDDDSAEDDGYDVSSNVLFNEDETSRVSGETSGNSSTRILVDDGTTRVSFTVVRSNETAEGPIVNGTDVDYYE